MRALSFLRATVGVSEGMKSAKAKSSSRKPKKSEPEEKDSRKPADLEAVRQRIRNTVGSHALAMVKTTMKEADKGKYMAMKCLFEMVGLYPATAAEDTPHDDVLARTLLQRLGLLEERAGSAVEAATEGVASAANTVE